MVRSTVSLQHIFHGPRIPDPLLDGQRDAPERLYRSFHMSPCMRIHTVILCMTGEPRIAQDRSEDSARPGLYFPDEEKSSAYWGLTR